MTGVLSKDLDDYFRQSRTFDGERAEAAVRSRKRAWLLASASAVLAAGSLCAIIAMLPLRTVDVHVFRVDSATGVVDLVAPLKGTQTYNEAVTKYFAALYVRMREGYLPDEARHAFRTVTLMSAADEQQRFADAVSPRNPKSLGAMLGQEGRADVIVKSITFPDRNLALVRFARTVRHQGQVVTSHAQATLSFTYVAGEMAESDRAINPLGFVVSQYRIDAETVP
jgi:type IV secretion system protein VirB8